VNFTVVLLDQALTILGVLLKFAEAITRPGINYLLFGATFSKMDYFLYDCKSPMDYQDLIRMGRFVPIDINYGVPQVKGVVLLNHKACRKAF